MVLHFELKTHLLCVNLLCICCCRKERKVFESYQHEAMAAKDKKDKEEIESLRKQVINVFTQAVICGISYSRSL